MIDSCGTVHCVIMQLLLLITSQYNTMYVIHPALSCWLVSWSFEFEPYLDKLVSRNLRSCITKLRLCAHNLRIHTGRYEHLDRNVRYCQVCNIHEIEDEFHFVFNCSLYNNLRQR